MEDEALVTAFMEATGCGREDAFDRLASTGGHLGRAINTFFSTDAGPSSGSRRRSRSRSPPPSSRPPHVSVSDSSSSSSSSSSEEDAVQARRRPVLAPAPARPRTGRVSRLDSETRVVVGRSSKSSRRRERRRRNRSRGSATAAVTPGGGDRPADGGNRGRRRRFREFREDIFSDGEEEDEEKEANNSPSPPRRRLNPPTEVKSEDGEEEKKSDDDDNSSRHGSRDDAIIVSSSSSSSDDDDDGNMLEESEEAVRPPPPSPGNNNRTSFEELFKVPRDLTFRGGFHAAKAHAARRHRWLLASLQSFELLPLPSLHQNRDVWGNALVARCVRDRFVLWQADAGREDDDGGQGEEVEEAKKVLGYYGVPYDRLPVVVVVDPVTGQAMDVLHGSAACELNDFMVRIGPFTETKPAIPVFMANKSTIVSASSVGGAQSSTRPAMLTTTSATTTAAPTSSEGAAAGSRQPAPTTVTRKQPAQQALTTTATTEPAVAPCTGQQQPESSVEEKVCKVRVRLADGRVVMKEFGSQCAVTALFAYCRSMLGADGGAPPEKPFRLLRFVGRETEEIGDQNDASFESLGLHLTTVSVVHLG